MKLYRKKNACMHACMLAYRQSRQAGRQTEETDRRDRQNRQTDRQTGMQTLSRDVRYVAAWGFLPES